MAGAAFRSGEHKSPSGYSEDGAAAICTRTHCSGATGGIGATALIVEQTLKRNIFEPALWVFSDDRRDRIKIVYWQRNGLCLWSKRLEGRDRFIFPRHIEGRQ